MMEWHVIDSVCYHKNSKNLRWPHGNHFLNSNSLLMPIKLMKLSISFYSVLHNSNRTFWIWEVWKPYNLIWKNSKHVHCKTSLIKTRSIPLTRMLLLQGKLHGALSFWRGILLQPGVGVEGLLLSPTQAWPPWSWGGGACESQVWAGDLFHQSQYRHYTQRLMVASYLPHSPGLKQPYSVRPGYAVLGLGLCKQLFSSISSRGRVDGCDFWIENVKLLRV